MNAINTHEYKEIIHKVQTWVKTGELKLLWGLIIIPQGKVHEELTHYGLCSRCGLTEFTSEHGYHKINP